MYLGFLRLHHLHLILWDIGVPLNRSDVLIIVWDEKKRNEIMITAGANAPAVQTVDKVHGQTPWIFLFGGDYILHLQDISVCFWYN